MAIGSDHTGVTLKAATRDALRSAAWRSTTSGTDGPIRSITPTSPRRWRLAVSRGEVDAGIVIDGAGIGSAIAANKMRGVQGGDVRPTRRSRAIRARAQRRQRPDAWRTLVTAEEAKRDRRHVADTPMREPRYIRRLAKIRDLEQNR